MGIVSSIVTTKARDLHDTAIKLMAKWDPESVGEAQIAEWDNQARELARSAAKAQTDAKAASEALENIRKNIANYTAAAEKLAATNEAAANKAGKPVSTKRQPGKPLDGFTVKKSEVQYMNPRAFRELF